MKTNRVTAKKQTPFLVMNNVRDNCHQPESNKFLMLTIATYCDRGGICYPTNHTLARVTQKSERTIQRQLKELVTAGEIEILAPGIGRDKKRIISLRRYAGKGDKAMSCLNTTPSLGKTSYNSQYKQPVNNSTELVPRVRSTLRGGGNPISFFSSSKQFFQPPPPKSPSSAEAGNGARLVREKLRDLRNAGTLGSSTGVPRERDDDL
jgi:hypothetical protein